MEINENEMLCEVYRRKPVSEPPAPWRRISCNVNGITAVGFGSGTDLLLVLTHSGLGVIDCATGNVLARQSEKDGDVEEPYPLSAVGIGPLAGQRVPLAGLWGGGLRTITSDGWVVHRASPNWPTECAVLCTPQFPELFDDPATATMLVKDLDPAIRALGFSDTGRSLVVANTDLFLWTQG